MNLIKTCRNCIFNQLHFLISSILLLSYFCQNVIQNFSLNVLIIWVLLCGFLLYINFLDTNISFERIVGRLSLILSGEIRGYCSAALNLYL